MRLILVGLGGLAVAGVAFAAVRFRARIARALRRVRHGLAARRSVFIPLLAGGFIVAIALFLWKAPVLRVAASPTPLSAKDIIELENQTRATWAQVVAGAFALLLVYLTWRRIEVAQEGQLTERFTRAIEQLGSEKLEVRLGGIYALERIARDSPKDHWTIMEVLTAFVRENAPWRDQPESSPACEPPPLRTDIQAILTVIGRRTRIYGKGEALPLDLSGTDLRRADLWGAHLERAHLRGAHLEEAYLIGAHLEGASLWDAHLEGAYLESAHLEGVDLRGVTGLTREQLAQAITDENTQFPDYLRPADEQQADRGDE